MADSILRRLKRQAKRRHLPWNQVQHCYEQLKADEKAKRERANEIRRQAWANECTFDPTNKRRWRSGFASRYQARIAAGADLTSIPEYDTFARDLACEFPELQGEDCSERVWAFLLGDCDPMPTRRELYDMAMDRVEAEQPQEGRGDWMTIGEAAAWLGVSMELMRRHCRNGWLGTMHKGRWWVSQSELEAFDEIDRPVGNPNWRSAAVGV